MAALFSDKLATHPKYYTIDSRCENGYFHHAFMENVNTVSKYHDTTYQLTTNSIGFKDAFNRKISLNPQNKRIVFIGDSFTEGLAVPYDSTFVGIIDKALQQEDIEVLNAAVASYSPKLYFLKTKYLLEKMNLKFNKLVVFVDISDIRDEIIYKNYIPTNQEPGSKLANYAKIYAIKHSVILNFADRIIEKTWPDLHDTAIQTEIKIISLYKNMDDYKYNVSGWYTDSNYALWGLEGSVLATQYMSELVSLCRNNGIEVVIAVYPWPRQIDENISENYHVLYWKKFAGDHGVPFINFFPFFMNSNADKIIDSYYIKDDNHFNEAGNRLIADEFLKWYQLNK